MPHTHPVSSSLGALAPVTQRGLGICTAAIDRRLCQCLTNLEAPGCNWNDWPNPHIKTKSLTTRASCNPNSALLVELAALLGAVMSSLPEKRHCTGRKKVFTERSCF